MSTQAALLTNIKQYICIDIKSDRANTRTQSLENIHNIFDNRADELCAILRSNNNNRDDDDSLSWCELFDGLHDAIIAQCVRIDQGRRSQNQKTLIAKNDAYKEALRKCINLANKHVPNVSYTKVCHAAFDCFENPSMSPHFDALYLQIILRHILNAKHSTSELKLTDWSRLLSYVFLAYEKSDSQIPKLDLLQCIPLILRHGTKNTYLVSDLHQYLPNVIQMVNNGDKKINAQKQILHIVYEFVRNLAVNQRLAIVQFTELILEKLISLYQSSIMDDDSKVILLKIMHIAMIVHSPESNVTNASKTDNRKNREPNDKLFEMNVADDAQTWHKHLRNMFGVIERDIKESRKRPNRLNPTPVICQTFVQVAAKLCSLVFWNQKVWDNGSEEQQHKKRRQTMKLERILELCRYEENKFCWRWFAILAELMTEYPQVLEAEDYQDTLKLLSDFQPTIQYSLQMKCFIQIADAMLSKEHHLKTTSTQIVDSFCTDRWHKIMEYSFKQAATDKTQLDNLDLLCILIKHGVIVSYEFIKKIISEIAEMSNIKKSNNSIKLLICILRNVNIDMIEDINKSKIAIINWLRPQVKLIDLKNVIGLSNTFDKHLMSELYVLCVLSRQMGAVNVNNESQKGIAEDDKNEHAVIISETVQLLKYRTLSKLIVSDAMQAKGGEQSMLIEKLPARNEVKASVDETLFGELDKAMHDTADQTSEQDMNSLESLNGISTSLATCVNVLNSLVGFESIDADTFCKFLTKRVFLKISQLNSIIESHGSSINVDRNPNDVNEVVENLLSVWNDKYHPIIAKNIFITKNSSSIIEWLKAQLRLCRREESVILSPLKTANELNFEERIQLKCLTLLMHFSAFEDEDEIDDDVPAVFEAIQKFTFKYKRNQDLFILFRLIKIILHQKSPSEQAIDWAFTEIQSVCQHLSSHNDYMELVAENIPALVKGVKPYPHMHDDLMILLSSFLKRIKTKKYGQRISIKAIKSVQYFVQEFFCFADCFDIIKGHMTLLNKFLQSEYLNIQFATVACMTNIFNKHWLNYDENEISSVNVQDFHKKLAGELKVQDLSIEQTADVDRKTCIVATRLQLYCSIIGSCYTLRKQMWFGLIEFCCNELKLSEHKTDEIVRRLCLNVFEKEPAVVLDDLFPYLLSLWIDKDYLLKLFPSILTQCENHDDFIIKYMDIITLRILEYKPRSMVDHLVNMVQARSLAEVLTKPILIKCLARLTSINVNDSTRECRANALNMLRSIKTDIPNVENHFDSHPLEIIEELLSHMWDVTTFQNYFDTDIEFVVEEHTINHDTFKKSLVYIQEKAARPTNIMHHFCDISPSKVLNILYSLKLNFQNAVCQQLKLSKLLQICTLVDIIVTDFLLENAKNQNQSHTVGFFIRDFVYFFGNTITSDQTTHSDKLKFATCKFFHKFCEKILPSCADHFQPHLNYVVSILIPITKSMQQTKIFDAGMSFLRFLIADQTDVLKQAIGQLDSFPMQPEFDDLRKIQNEVKYNGKSFSLLEEIEYFLSVDKRKIEGLLSLKEHLSRKKDELKELYKTIYDSRGFSEDCEKSPIHRLISALLVHIVQNVDSERSFVAAKCLGELGSNDLGSIALKVDVQSQTYNICKSFNRAVLDLCEHLLEKLNGIFIHSDATVLQAAAEASRYLLQSDVAMYWIKKRNTSQFLKIFESTAVMESPLKKINMQSNLGELFKDEAFGWEHSFWVKKLAIELFTLFQAEPLAEVAAKQTPFSAAMIPLLVKVLLNADCANHRIALNQGIGKFFIKNFNHLSGQAMEVDSSETHSNQPIYLNKVSIRLMLNIAECIRMQNLNSGSSERLKLNYLHIAKAALFCEAYFTAILYGELASYENSGDNTQSDEIKSIMKNAYQSIGETDAVSAFLDPIKQKMEYLEMNQRWNRLLIGVDAQSDQLSTCVKYLGQAGLYKLANKLTQNTNFTDYECAWRLSDWSIVEGNAATTSTQNDEFEKYHYFALKSLDKKHLDSIRVKSNVEKAYEAIIKRFKQSSYECTKNIYKNLKMLHLLQQIEEFCYIQFRGAEDENYKPQFIFDKWKCQDQIASCEFSHRETILAQRLTLFSGSNVGAQRKIANFSDGTQHLLLNLVSECRKEGFNNHGERYSSMLNQMNLSKEIQARALIEDAQLSWSRGDSEIAQHLIQAVMEKKIPSFTICTATGMMGEYLAEARLEDTKTIIQKYLMESMVLSSKLKQMDLSRINNTDYDHPPEERERLDLLNRKRNYHAIAKYADREYQQIAAYKKSTEFGKKQKSLTRNQSILSEMRSRKQLSQDEKRSFHLLTKSLEIDEADVKSTKKEYDAYLHLAIENYIQCLLFEDSGESSTIFRLFGLWFANISDQAILTEMQEHYNNIPTYKFITLMPQITAQLSNESIKTFIEELLIKCALDHPHHVLPKVLALVNAFKDEEILNQSMRSNSPRTDAAVELLSQMKENSGLRAIIDQMEKMCDVLIRLANVEMKKSGEFGTREAILTLRNLDLVHCPTVNLPISISGDYRQKIVSIKRWESKYSIVGGINLPKRIECIGSDGKQYLQLLKGKDDIRQDAVMQQVFNIMNDMLTQSKVTKKDRLHVRTYVIVPLSQRSGILEWCQNTIPLTEYLVGSDGQGAHERIHPKDWTPNTCRSKLGKTPLRATPFDTVYKNFLDICRHIKPVFHHFFFERYHNPGKWFERRLAYAHSLATTSMIGYILGIGDRHVSNILIDEITAELIHIDFGIAFEQGKCLPTPELIPFRLTRDMVSALGPSGVEGVYRKSCEKTMEVLRQNKSTILTIVEVLLHDPLYAWSLTSDQASRRQQTDIEISKDDDPNTMAERTLWRLEEKLDGKHVSRSDAISAKRHVEILIKEATNEKLLCRLYVGWQPYL